jgi:hypothetical protein
MLSKSVYLSVIVIAAMVLLVTAQMVANHQASASMENITGTIIMENITIRVSRLATTTAMAATPTVIAKC